MLVPHILTNKMYDQFPDTQNTFTVNITIYFIQICSSFVASGSLQKHPTAKHTRFSR